MECDIFERRKRGRITIMRLETELDRLGIKYILEVIKNDYKGN